LLANRLPTQGFVANWMKHVPGAVLAALVAPAVLAVAPGRSLAEAFMPAEMVAAAAVALIYVGTRNLSAAMAGGVVVVYLMRLWLAA
jgi:branched-subunit amino acid transport protein